MTEAVRIEEAAPRAGRFRAFGPWIPVVILAAVMIAGMLAAPSERFEPAWLLPSLNLVFQTLVPLAAAAIAIAAYRRTGVAAILALGAGMLATGIGCGVVPALLVVGGRPTDGVTIHNASALVAAAAHFTAALGGVAGVTFGPGRRRHVTLAYGATTVVVGAIVLGAIGGAIAPFWQDGPTPARIATLMGGALLFALASFAWWQTAMRDRSIRFLHWYAPGLAAIGLGLAVMIANGVIGGLLSWLGRSGQYLGAVYLLIAVASEALPGLAAWRTVRQDRRAGDERVLGVALLQAALPFRPLVESTSDAVIALGRSGRILYWNEAAHRRFGFHASEAFDRDPIELLRPAGREGAGELRRLVGRRAAEGSGASIETLLIDRAGRAFPAEIRTFAGAEDPRLTVLVITDVSQRVRSREELERLVRRRTEELASANAALVRTNADLERTNHELERANAAKDEFLGLVSHELKTPITTILAASSLLGRAGVDSADLVEDVAAEAARLGGIVDNLLALARLDSGREVEREPILLERLVATSVRAAERQYPGRTIEVSAEHGTIVEGNEEQLAMVLRNYLGNALKYSGAGTQVEVVLRQEAGRARLAVLDRGPGIGEGDPDELFEPFRRGERTAAVAGIGIGLTVCRRIVEVHGGRVGAGSRYDGPGAVFWLELPLGAGIDAEEPLPAVAGGGTVAVTIAPKPRRAHAHRSEADRPEAQLPLGIPIEPADADEPEAGRTVRSGTGAAVGNSRRSTD